MPNKSQVDWIEVSKGYVRRLPKVSYALIAIEINSDQRTVSRNIKETLNSALVLLEAHKGIK